MTEGTTPEYHVEELTEEEQAALVAEGEHHGEPSCQSDEQSEGESDLSLQAGGEG